VFNVLRRKSIDRLRVPAGIAAADASVPVARFYVYLLALIFAIGLLATSLNMVLGFGGMYQFHHAVFYGFGAYAFALLAQIGLPPGWATCSPPSVPPCWGW
jgi:branched-chain amino acid transport system permease protein